MKFFLLLVGLSMVAARPYPETTFDSPFPGEYQQFLRDTARVDQGLAEPDFARAAFPAFPTVQFPFQGQLHGNQRQKRETPVFAEVVRPASSHRQPSYGYPSYQAPSHGDGVAYGADTTGGYGAFTWYSDHPVGGGYHR